MASKSDYQTNLKRFADDMNVPLDVKDKRKLPYDFLNWNLVFSRVKNIFFESKTSLEFCQDSNKLFTKTI